MRARKHILEELAYDILNLQGVYKVMVGLRKLFIRRTSLNNYMKITDFMKFCLYKLVSLLWIGCDAKTTITIILNIVEMAKSQEKV